MEIWFWGDPMCQLKRWGTNNTHSYNILQYKQQRQWIICDLWHSLIVNCSVIERATALWTYLFHEQWLLKFNNHDSCNLANAVCLIPGTHADTCSFPSTRRAGLAAGAPGREQRWACPVRLASAESVTPVFNLSFSLHFHYTHSCVSIDHFQPTNLYSPLHTCLWESPLNSEHWRL